MLGFVGLVASSYYFKENDWSKFLAIQLMGWLITIVLKIAARDVPWIVERPVMGDVISLGIAIATAAVTNEYSQYQRPPSR